MGIAEGTKIVTTNASKHGLRAAAKERSNRHAQRTPLPPKPGVIEDAREVIAAGAAMQAAESHGDATDAKSMGKAEAFAEKARAAKWDVTVEPVGGVVELTATRGAETIIQAWAGGVWDYDTSFYGYGDRTTKPRNASGAIKLLERTPADASAEASKVSSNRHFRKAEPKDIEVRLEEAQQALPFDPSLAPDEEVAGILAGQALVWYNRLSRGQESAMVGRKGVRFFTLADGQRGITFCCPVTGYRSCLVTAILKVGRGRSLVTAGSATEGTAKVEVA